MRLRPLTKSKRGVFEATVTELMTGAIGLLVLAGIIVGITSFKNSQVTSSAGCNATVQDACNTAYNLTRSTELLSNNFSSQLGTVGTMFGVALIIGAIGLLGFGIAAGVGKLQ